MVTGGEAGDFWNLACVIINPYFCTAATERVHFEPELNATVWASEGTEESGLSAASAKALVPMSNHRTESKQFSAEEVGGASRNSNILGADTWLGFRISSSRIATSSVFIKGGLCCTGALFECCCGKRRSHLVPNADGDSQERRAAIVVCMCDPV